MLYFTPPKDVKVTKSVRTRGDRASVLSTPQVKGIRKKLFKAPSTESIYRTYRQSTIHRSITKNKTSILSQQLENDDESLLEDVKDVRKRIFYLPMKLFKSPKSVRRNSVDEIEKVMRKTAKVKRELSQSENEFFHLEQQIKLSDENSPVKRLQLLLEEEHAEYERFKYEHDRRFKLIMKCLEECQNVKKKATGIQKKTKSYRAQENKTPTKRSERITATNLRVSMLKQNLKKHTVTLSTSTTAVKKEEKMHASFENDCDAILSTPKVTEFASVRTPSQQSTRKVIGRRIEQLCLMLQDTPL